MNWVTSIGSVGSEIGFHLILPKIFKTGARSKHSQNWKGCGRSYMGLARSFPQAEVVALTGEKTSLISHSQRGAGLGLASGSGDS